ncbi:MULTISPECIES: hypothetical protein [Methylobacterium]|jgi:hypothetical protein|uniref:PilZ domain-containing protein n=1 Tax=Methylobacterium longum TaxID=767694 RepID=A0ABT8AMZ7_9HYPH|nr:MULTISPECIES: hypothetical protein [Methylobacterium]MCJ2103529.1 hypothetical protein [Methylobacterium sp. E-046]MDN3571269.1 hypothetical protein [Methylobacterium longum]GJE09117.1 hypothetical protein FOHLNKBM_0137 [Methylobacterium longum]
MPANPLKPRAGFSIATAAFGEPLRTIDCVVLVEGRRGAVIELSNPERLPDEFLLIATSIQIRRPCRVVERGADGVRVEFIRA